MARPSACLLAAALVAAAAGAAPPPGEREAIEQEMRELRKRMEALERRLDAYDDAAAEAAESDGGGPAGDPAEALERPATPEPDEPTDPAPAPAPMPMPEAGATPPAATTDVWSRDVGRTRLRLVDLGLDVVATVGSSTEGGDSLAILQGGAHDPRQRGFTLNQVELSLIGAVDPYLRAETFILFFIDPDGETRVELEEAFFVTQMLPFGLHRAGLQLEGGTYLTDFGRINTQHPHFWTFLDQPIVATRFLGGDGLRGPGALAAWLLPTPWFSELRAGVQNARGETQVSFLANDEVFEERPIGGRPFASQTVNGASDMTWNLRWANGFDISDAWSTQLGLSAALGPNATGNDGGTQIYGLDAVFKWRPLDAQRGWPFVVLQTEAMYRRYEADAFAGPIDGSPAILPRDVLRDWGLYAQGVWGFYPRWAAGFRFEYAQGGGGPSYDGATAVPIDADPFRAARYRISPLVAFHPSEFSRLRLQYNYDDAAYLDDGRAHSLWFGVEFNFGAHPAHAY